MDFNLTLIYTQMLTLRILYYSKMTEIIPEMHLLYMVKKFDH
jgi:hypothetical protein